MFIFSAVTTKIQVGFTAHSIKNNRKPGRYKPLIFGTVVFNDGNGYNNTDGHFYVPHSGLYYFTATAGNHFEKQIVSFYLYVDNTKLAYGYIGSNFYDFNTAHAVVHLNKGQRVGVKSWTPNRFFTGTSCQFTGLLVRPDF